MAVIDALESPVEEFHTLGQKYGTKAIYRTADVTKEDSLTSAFEGAVGDLGPFHGCVTAAGIALDKPFSQHKWDESHRVLMVRQHRSRIVAFRKC